jgi:glycosyltransferase involved in cell wall biosynthesis
LKILIACNDLDYFLAHRANLLKPLLDRGHKVSVCAGGNWTSRGRLSKDVHFIPIELAQHHLDPRSDLKLMAHYARIVDDIKPDTVHCLTIKPNLYMGLVLALRRLQLKKTPRLVQTFPGLGKVFEPSSSIAATARRRFVAMLLRVSGSLLDRTATFENTADRDILVYGGVVSAARAHVIAGAGLDMKIYRPPETPRAGGLHILFASRLLKAKGVGTFLDVAKTIRSEGGEATFLIPRARFESC